MFALLTVLALLAAACGGSTASPSASVDAGKSEYKACLSLDQGGPADKNFNQSAYEGLLALEAEGFEIAYTTAQTSADYAPNIQQLIDQNCNTVIAVGYNQGDALKAAVGAADNAAVAFGWVDATWTLDDGTIPANFTGIDFQIDEASMLAAYLAAGISKTKVIATYGGAPYPGVTKFMDGWVAGANYYADKKGVAVNVLGWIPAKNGNESSGTFNPNVGAEFTDPLFGTTTAEAFMGQSADVVHAVAGGTGNGTYQAMLDAGKYSVGVDLDQCVSLPEYCGTLLTSAQKNIGAAVITAVNGNYAGEKGGSNYIGTLKNGGVQIATLDRTESAWTATFGSLVTAELKAEVDALKAEIIAGTVVVADWTKK
jgi:basic membrane protein A